MKERNSDQTQELASAKSGMSVSSGYRTEKGLRQHKKPRSIHGHTLLEFQNLIKIYIFTQL